MLHVAWIHPGRLENVLSAATHLETTRELRKMGVKVTLFAPGDNGTTTVRGVEVSGLPFDGTYFLGQASFHRKVWSAIERMSPAPDVVLFHQSSAIWVLPRVRWRRLRGLSRPLAIMDTRSVHMPPESGERLRGRLRRHYTELANRSANRWCDGQTAITERMARRVRIPAEQLWAVWPSGVDPEAFRRHTPRSWPGEGETTKLIYIGSLHRERNLLGLAQAVVGRRREGASIRLSLVGSGNEWEELERLAREAPDALELSRPVPHEEVPELLARHHVGVLPFPDEEKFRVSSPIKLFEYLASGLPILATRVACHTDVLEGTDCVFWAESGEVEDLADALRAIEIGRGELPGMSEASLRQAESWSWRSAAEKLLRGLRDGLERMEERGD